MRCFLLDETGFPRACDHGSVVPCPYLTVRMPLPTRLLYLCPPLPLGQTDAHAHPRRGGQARLGRFQGSFRAHPLNGLTPLLLRRILARTRRHKAMPRLCRLYEPCLDNFLTLFAM